MSDNNDYLRTSSRNFRLSADILALMMKGAGYALVFCVAMLVISMLAVFVSGLLPEASKEASDPTPQAFMMDLVPASQGTA